MYETDHDSHLKVSERQPFGDILLSATRPSRQILGSLRTRDAASGRDLLAGVWGSETADVRLRLLGAMQTGLSNEDKSFLTTAAKDRASRVTALAQRLLARLAGAGAENPPLPACLERIVKPHSLGNCSKLLI